MAEHRSPDVHGESEESAWEGGGRSGLENYRHHRYEEHREDALTVSDEEIEDKRRPAPGHGAITPGATGPSTREVEPIPGASESANAKTEVAGPLKGIPDLKA